MQKNKDVKVLQLSATPINNRLTDIRNQFKLIKKGFDEGFRESEISIKSLQNIIDEDVIEDLEQVAMDYAAAGIEEDTDLPGELSLGKKILFFFQLLPILIILKSILKKI